MDQLRYCTQGHVNTKFTFIQNQLFPLQFEKIPFLRKVKTRKITTEQIYVLFLADGSIYLGTRAYTNALCVRYGYFLVRSNTTIGLKTRKLNLGALPPSAFSNSFLQIIYACEDWFIGNQCSEISCDSQCCCIFSGIAVLLLLSSMHPTNGTEITKSPKENTEKNFIEKKEFCERKI